jgi:hypothetical protein
MTDEEIEGVVVDLIIARLTGDERDQALAYMIKVAAAHRHLSADRYTQACRRAGGRGMKCLLFVALLLAVPCVALAASPVSADDTVRDLMSLQRDLDNACRGGTPDDNGNLDRLCTIRDRLSKAINRLGYCYGKRGQYGYQMQWHKCTSVSLRN